MLEIEEIFKSKMLKLLEISKKKKNARESKISKFIEIF